MKEKPAKLRLLTKQKKKKFKRKNRTGKRKKEIEDTKTNTVGKTMEEDTEIINAKQKTVEKEKKNVAAEDSEPSESDI